MSTITKTIFVALTVFSPYLQHNQDVFYTESWKKGTHQVKEQKIYIKLSNTNPEYETLIEDSSGQARYKLQLWPGRVNGNNSEIIEWMIELTDVTHENEGDLLRRSNDKEQDYFSAKDRIGWLYPLESPKSINAESDVVPIFAKRVVKIENFYLIIEVKDFHFSPNKKGLQSITIQVEFANTYKGEPEQTTASPAFNYPRDGGWHYRDELHTRDYFAKHSIPIHYDFPLPGNFRTSSEPA